MSDRIKDAMMIVASHPDSPHCAYAGCWETEGYQDDAMNFWREYEARGAIVRRVDSDTGRAMMKAYNGRGK